MHKYMSAIGFHDCRTKRQLDEIVKQVLSHPDTEQQVQLADGRRLFQMNKEFANQIGMSVIGELDQRGFRTVLFSFPYIKGDSVTNEEEIQLQKFAEKDAYAGISEDYNIGVSLIFYLINIASYLEKKNLQYHDDYHTVRLSALSTEGRILFGIEKNEEQLRQEMDGQNKRYNLIQEAKNGNMEAIESLTLEDIDLYSCISKRVQTEDIYSIVDTTFLPYGVESDQYSVLGNIISVEQAVNNLSGEAIYLIELVCNDLYFVVAINQKDLLGTPKVGYRFKGNIWMQGILE